MKAALTGVHGLVGCAINATLKETGIDTLALSRDSGFSLHHINTKPIIDFAPDIFIHTAWAGTDSTLRNDAELLEMNYHASLRLLEIAADSGCKRFISFGSQAEYSDPLSSPIAEIAPTEPHSAYGKTKLALYEMLQELAYKRDIHLVWLRLFTCYGRNQNPRYVLHHLIDSLSHGYMPELQAPHAVWDFLHVDDAAEAVLSRVKKPNASGVYNLASGAGISVGELALMIARMVKFEHMAALEQSIAESADAATYRVADISKFSRDFSWQPKISIEEGVLRLCHTS